LKEEFYQELLFLAPDAPEARFLLAVSGGKDSVALAHLFVSCNLIFDIAHCNFHLRGEESNRDMAFVQKLPFLTHQKVFVKEFDTLAIQQQSGKSIEMVARTLRYKWFEEIGQNYHYIVTAHHANDNAETILMNLLRGTGLRGMCGIPHQNGKIIRPFLQKFNSSVIETYLKENELNYCVDSTNVSSLFLRNKIRNQIIPELKKINPKVIEIFAKNSQLFSQQTQFFDTQINHFRNNLLQKMGERVIINIEALNQNENAALILYELLQPYGFNASEVKNIINTTHSISGKRFLSDTHTLLKDRNNFIIEKRESKNEEVIVVNSIEELEQYGFKVAKYRYFSTFKAVKSKNIIYIDAKKISFPLIIRRWERGDFFYPFGMKSKKKVSDFFTAQKIDLFEKQKIRFLCSDQQIVWIINHRADERFRVNKDTEWYYMVTSVK